MLRDREELEKELYGAIESITHNRKKVQEINKGLAEYGVYAGTFNEIKNGKVRLESLELKLLCALTIVLKETGNSTIHPSSYFTENEIEASKHQVEKKLVDLVQLPYAFLKVEEINHQEYFTKIKMSELVKLYNSGLVEYDFETQRSPKYKKSGDSIVLVPEINESSVSSICSHMLNGTYMSDTMTLNIYSESVEPISYNVKTRELTANSGAVISILDGFHRLQGGVRAVKSNPELELTMQLSIKSFDTETSKKYFGQINTLNYISKARLQELKEERLSDSVVKNLLLKSELKGRVSSSAQVSEIAGHLTTFPVLSDAINDIFVLKSNLDVREASSYLSEFFDYLLGSFPEVFIGKPAHYRDTSYYTNPNIFVGYIVLAKRFLDNGIKPSNIKEVMKGISFDKKNSELASVLENSYFKDNSKKVRTKIRNYFEKVDLNKIGGATTHV